MRRNILLSIIIFLSLCYIITSCSTDDTDLQLLEEQYKIKPTLNKETSEFKSAFISVLNSNKSRVSNKEIEFSNEQIDILKDKSLKLFKSHGFSKKELNKYGIKSDEHLILSATIFTALMENPSLSQNIKTRSENDETCYNGTSISDCLLRVTGIHEIITGCLTKKAILKILGKYVPYIGWATAVADFANCMGWVDWW